jgi:two-component sensor histidine kinase
MLLHELGTNAAKYGALSNRSGTVTLDWGLEGQGDHRQIVLTWREVGGPAVVPPTRKGFGSRLIEEALKAQQGDAKLDYAAEGLICTLRLAYATSTQVEALGAPI